MDASERGHQKSRWRVGVLIVLAAVAVAFFLEKQLPPAAARKFVCAINADPHAAVAGITPSVVFDPRPYYMDLLGRGKPPWRITSFEPATKFQTRFKVRDATGDETFVILTHQGDGSIETLHFWPYIQGSTLAQMAGSALSRTGSPGVALAFWKDGEEAVEVRGVRDKVSQDALRASDTWPCELNGSLIQLTTAKMVEAGDLRWDQRVTDLLGIYELPSTANGVRVSDLLERRVDKIDLARPVISPGKFDDNTKIGYIRAAFDPHTQSRGQPSEHAFSPDNTILTAVIEEASRRPVEDMIATTVLEPLGMGAASFGKPDVRPTAGPPHPPVACKAPFLAKGRPFCVSLPELLKFGRLKLDEERRISHFLTLDSFSRLGRRTGVDWAGIHQEVDWGWISERKNSVTFWRYSASRVDAGGETAVELLVLPEQNAVIAVAMIGENRYISDKVSPILWRIAERLCGFPKK